MAFISDWHPYDSSQLLICQSNCGPLISAGPPISVTVTWQGKRFFSASQSRTIFEAQSAAYTMGPACPLLSDQNVHRTHYVYNYKEVNMLFNN
jgi:hypothetical protein